MRYDFSTSRPACNDNTKDTWEVEALGTDGQWWCVSDSGTLSEEEAASQAESMRKCAAEDEAQAFADPV